MNFSNVILGITIIDGNIFAKEINISINNSDAQNDI